VFETKNDLSPTVREAHLFTEVSREIDKWLWFLEAHARSRR
jgi:hypothetical protein